MVNKVILLGNLAADPERRTTPQGTPVVNIRLATNERFRDRDGNLQERSEFHRIVFWGRQAETIDRYARKGNPLYVEGRIQTREYQDRDGNRRWATEIVARDFRFISGGRRDEGQAAGGPRGESGGWAARDRGERPSAPAGGGWAQEASPASPAAPSSSAGGSEPFTSADDEWGGNSGPEEDLPF